MLKLYSMEWQHPWGAPYTMHYPPNPDIFTMEMVAELRGVFNHYNQVVNVCLFRGFVAAVDLDAAVEAIRREFPWAEVTHCNLMIPPLLPEYFGITFDWSIERINYYNQTRGLLPGSVVNPNLNVLGWSAVTYFEPPPTPVHHSVEHGVEYPYDDRSLPLTTERTAVLGLLANLSNRQGVGDMLDSVDDVVREEMVDSLTEIVKSVLNK